MCFIYEESRLNAVVKADSGSVSNLCSEIVVVVGVTKPDPSVCFSHYRFHNELWLRWQFHQKIKNKVLSRNQGIRFLLIRNFV